MIPKIKAVKPLPQYNLLVTFQNNEKKKYDVGPLIKKRAAFKMLGIVKYLFEQVKVDQGGYGVVWNDEIDLACEQLYEKGSIIQYKGYKYLESRKS